jgi:hypothetical protein
LTFLTAPILVEELRKKGRAKEKPGTQSPRTFNIVTTLDLIKGKLSYLYTRNSTNPRYTVINTTNETQICRIIKLFIYKSITLFRFRIGYNSYKKIFDNKTRNE